MKKILFIIPPHIGYDEFANPAIGEHSDNIVRYLPQGVLYLSAFLKSHIDVDIRLIDFNVNITNKNFFKYESFDDFFYEKLSDFSSTEFVPDIIGISILFSSAFYNSIKIANACHKIFGDSMLLAGGGVPTALSIDIYSITECFDAICYGEGENPLLNLIQAEDTHSFLRSSSCWITKEKQNSTFKAKSDLIIELDEIPSFDFSIVNLDDYQVNFTVSHFGNENTGSTLPIHTSRGCPHKCCFCGSHVVHGRKVRYHSIERVKKDIMLLKSRYGAKRILISDDNFTANKDRAKKLFSFMADNGLEVHSQGGFTMHSLDEDMLRAMQKAGLNSINLPIESGSERVLQDIMHKPLNYKIIKKVTKTCRTLGIDTIGFILIGLPGETPEDIQCSIDFLSSIDVNWFNITIATPLIGSELYKICAENDYFDSDPFLSDFRRAVITTPDFTAEFIEKKAYEMNLFLNFVNNLDMREKRFDKALVRYKNIATACKDHAFAYYFMSKCYKHLANKEQHNNTKNIYKKIIADSTFWQEHVNHFKLPPL